MRFYGWNLWTYVSNPPWLTIEELQFLVICIVSIFWPVSFSLKVIGATLILCWLRLCSSDADCFSSVGLCWVFITLLNQITAEGEVAELFKEFNYISECWLSWALHSSDLMKLKVNLSKLSERLFHLLCLIKESFSTFSRSNIFSININWLSVISNEWFE